MGAGLEKDLKSALGGVLNAGLGPENAKHFPCLTHPAASRAFTLLAFVNDREDERQAVSRRI